MIASILALLSSLISFIPDRRQRLNDKYKDWYKGAIERRLLRKNKDLNETPNKD